MSTKGFPPLGEEASVTHDACRPAGGESPAAKTADLYFSVSSVEADGDLPGDSGLPTWQLDLIQVEIPNFGRT